MVNYKLERIWKDPVVAPLRLCRHVLKTEENHERLPSVQLMSRPRFELSISRILAKSVTTSVTLFSGICVWKPRTFLTKIDSFRFHSITKSTIRLILVGTTIKFARRLLVETSDTKFNFSTFGSCGESQPDTTCPLWLIVRSLLKKKNIILHGKIYISLSADEKHFCPTCNIGNIQIHLSLWSSHCGRHTMRLVTRGEF